MPTLIRECRSVWASNFISKNHHKIPQIVIPKHQQRKLSDMILDMTRARINGAAMKNLLIHGMFTNDTNLN